MDKLKRICKKIIDLAPLVIGGTIGIILAMGLLGFIDLGVTFATVGAFLGKAFLWIIGIAIGIFVAIAFFPGAVIIVIAAVILLVVLLLIGLIGAIL